MISQLRTLLGPAHRAQYTRFLMWAGLYGILQGCGVSLLVPIIRSLYAGRWCDAWAWIAALAMAAAGASIAHYIQAMSGFRTALTTVRALHQRIGSHLARLPLGWFLGKTGSITQVAIAGTSAVSVVPAHLLTPVVVGLTAPAAVTVSMLIFDWRLGLALILAAPVIILVGRISAWLIAHSAKASHKAEAAASDRIIEFARCQAALRSCGRGGDPGGYRPLNEAITAQRANARRALITSVIGSSLNGITIQAVFTVFVMVAVNFALDGSLTGIDLFALLAVAFRFTGPLTDVADFGGQIRSCRAEIERIHTIMSTPALPEPSHPVEPVEPGAITFDHVSFCYAPDAVILEDLSFTVPPQTMTALVGPSGSGKTTITRLIARFWDVDSGSVQVGGADVRDQRTETLMAQLAIVFQDVYLFDETLRENIRMGNPEASPDQIAQAAELAGVTEIAHRLPQGWDTRVGEAGAVLSGGERQRVAVARALLKNAPILILDEASAALDPENERFVQASLDSLRNRTSLVVIAHQLSTVMAADQILVLDEQGRLDECGHHSELITRPHGSYAAFWREQFRTRSWQPDKSKRGTVADF